ncbi:MAG: hypothetical protein PVF58_13055 [Candidatus Methanofastidiosia archaeon]|jgi:hypothetical protein
MNNPLKYFIVGVIFWFLVDFTTTEAIRNPGFYYSVYMPALLIFYIGYPLLFSFLIYKFNFEGKKLLITTLIAAFFLEAVVFQNPLLTTFPMLFIGIPAAISLYGFITYGPKWIVNGEIKNNKGKLTIMILVYVLISLATVLGTGSGS